MRTPALQLTVAKLTPTFTIAWFEASSSPLISGILNGLQRNLWGSPETLLGSLSLPSPDRLHLWSISHEACFYESSLTCSTCGKAKHLSLTGRLAELGPASSS